MRVTTAFSLLSCPRGQIRQIRISCLFATITIFAILFRKTHEIARRASSKPNVCLYLPVPHRPGTSPGQPGTNWDAPTTPSAEAASTPPFEGGEPSDPALKGRATATSTFSGHLQRVFCGQADTSFNAKSQSREDAKGNNSRRIFSRQKQ